MLIGLTGGIACGKSAATRLFARHGCATIDTDTIAHQILSETDVKTALRSRWGNMVFDTQGTPDRPRIGQIVFTNPEEKNWLENLLHPRVHQHWQDWAQTQRGQVAIVEIPLLFEKKLENNFDLTVSVHCAHATQLARMAERGLNAAQAVARLANQWSLDEKMRRAHHCLFNEGSLSFLERQVLLFLSRPSLARAIQNQSSAS